MYLTYDNNVRVSMMFIIGVAIVSAMDNTSLSPRGFTRASHPVLKGSHFHKTTKLFQ